jgi:hypothetical protein
MLRKNIQKRHQEIVRYVEHDVDRGVPGCSGLDHHFWLLISAGTDSIVLNGFLAGPDVRVWTVKPTPTYPNRTSGPFGRTGIRHAGLSNIPNDF